MTDRERNILNMLIAVGRFDDANKTDYDDLPDAEANFAIVRATIAALEDHSSEQISGAAGRASEQKSVLRASIRRKMKRYARTARALDIDDPGLRRLFRQPDSDNDQLLLATGREFVEEARRFNVQFASHGIPAALAAELDEDIAGLETAIGAKAGARIAGVGATAGIDDEIERGMEAAIVLDSIMHNVYHDNPVRLAEWTSARHVRKSKRSPVAEVGGAGTPAS